MGIRTIIFRGKRKDNGEWVYGDFMHGNERKSLRDSIFVYDSETQSFNDYEIDSSTIGQYTGLTDKNGKKIFEGDIIRYADLYDYYIYLDSVENPEAYEKIDEGYIWTIDEVVYAIKDGYPAFDLNKHDFEANGLSELSESGQYFYEVIGNIHDNKLEDFEDGN